MAPSRPAKRARLLSEDESDSDGDASSSQGESNQPVVFSINEEFAKRFEHNKKREERQQLEEKYNGHNRSGRQRNVDEDDEGDDSDSTTSESEDDDAELATAELDVEIMDTLNAIRKKDPRVYDSGVKFYKEFDPDVGSHATRASHTGKPMFLHDYQRQNLLATAIDGSHISDHEPKKPTYQEEQDALRQEVVGAMHNTSIDPEDDEDDFLVRKTAHNHDNQSLGTQTRHKVLTDKDVAEADRDPEKYLSNFMSARAWLPTEGSRFAPLESDDSDEDARADSFEAAYNLRFEDPKKANEKLQLFARDVGKHSARRSEQSKRKKTRESEREKKAGVKRERDEEKTRLRKLKIEEAEEKVQQIKEAAGLTNQDVDLNQWRDIIEGDFNDAQWDAEMTKRFGDEYYQVRDRSGKLAKPMWDDDIGIDDLVPEFTYQSQSIPADGGEATDGNGVEVSRSSAPGDSRNSREEKERKSTAKRAARKQRMQIEAMVDDSLATDPVTTTGRHAGFTYRQTSPTTFGLTSRDILFAEDAQLNEYVGLKKLATFRDDAKKLRDKKKYSKKSRLKAWRQETFGNADGPVLKPSVQEATEADRKEDKLAQPVAGQKRKRRQKKGASG